MNTIENEIGKLIVNGFVRVLSNHSKNYTVNLTNKQIGYLTTINGDINYAMSRLVGFELSTQTWNNEKIVILRAELHQVEDEELARIYSELGEYLVESKTKYSKKPVNIYSASKLTMTPWYIINLDLFKFAPVLAKWLFDNGDSNDAPISLKVLKTAFENRQFRFCTEDNYFNLVRVCRVNSLPDDYYQTCLENFLSKSSPTSRIKETMNSEVNIVIEHINDVTQFVYNYLGTKIGSGTMGALVYRSIHKTNGFVDLEKLISKLDAEDVSRLRSSLWKNVAHSFGGSMENYLVEEFIQGYRYEMQD